MVDEDKLFEDEEDLDPALLDDEEEDEDDGPIIPDEDDLDEDELDPKHLGSHGFGLEEDEI